MNIASLGIDTILFIIAFVANLFVATIVISETGRKRTNDYFFMFAMFAALWVLSNYFFYTAPVHLRYMIALSSYSFAFIMIIFTLLSTHRIAYNNKRTLPERTILWAGTILGVIFGIPGVVGTGIGSDGLSIETNKFPLIFLALLIVLQLAYSISTLIGGMRKSKGQDRRAFIVMFTGLCLTSFAAILCNLLLPLIDVYSFVRYGALSIIFYNIAMAYSIIHHGLFDLREALNKTIAEFSAVAIVTTLVFFIIITPDYVGFEPGLVYYMSFFIILLLSFSSIRRNIETALYKFFPDGRYKISTFISQSIVALQSKGGELSFVRIIRHVMVTMKATSVVVCMQGNDDELHYELSKGATMSEEDIELIFSKASRVRDIIHIDDALAGHDKLRDILEDRKVSFLLPIVDSGTLFGYMLVGERQRGRYTTYDHRALVSLSGVMSIALQSMKQSMQIREINDSLEVKVKQATARLRKSNQHLRALDKTKDDFMSMASHNLRTPLTSIKGYVSGVLEGDAGEINDLQRMMLTQAFNSSNRMVSLVGDLLNISRIQSGRFVKNETSFDIATVITEEVENMRELAKNHKVILDVNLPVKKHNYKGDKEKLRQVIMNLIDNAIFYSPEKDAIVKVVLQYTKTHIKFYVKDTGIGVPEDMKSRLFSKFNRADNARAQRPDGTGIGLYMAKEVVELHGGAMIFESTEGKGSVFGFELPLHTQ